MSDTLSTQKSKQLNFGRPPAGFGPQMRWLLLTVLPAIGRALGIKINISGASSSSKEADGSLNFRVKTVTSTASGPLAVNEDGTVTYGTILGVEPTIDTTPIHEGPTLTLPSSGTRWIVATVTGTPTQTTLSGDTFTHALTDIAVAIAVESADPAVTEGLHGTNEFKFTIAVLDEGVLYQNGNGPITGGLDDLMLGTGVAALNLSYPGS